MHRKSIEAAEHLKDDNTNSDHEETTSMRTDASDTSATSSQPPNHVPNNDSTPDPQHPAGNGGVNSQQAYPEDPEAFRNNSIACLRAKAQEHSAKLLNHNLMLQVRPQPSCDANANNLHRQEVVSGGENSAMF
ncbi:hypothetical protein JTB14_001804 [Gonioctena quinquepunctata]|nr:hypothetical protein JTB14_001804 [Gonioctena quinquepunctata]